MTLSASSAGLLLLVPRLQASRALDVSAFVMDKKHLMSPNGTPAQEGSTKAGLRAAGHLLSPTKMRLSKRLLHHVADDELSGRRLHAHSVLKHPYAKTVIVAAIILDSLLVILEPVDDCPPLWKIILQVYLPFLPYSLPSSLQPTNQSNQALGAEPCPCNSRIAV